jgi:ATP citrate (pro-S)-lyase
MSAKAVREYDGKLLLAHWLLRTPIPATSVSTTGSKFVQPATRLAHVKIDTALLNTEPTVFAQHVQTLLDHLEQTHPWLLTSKLVAKPDQLIKRRGKSGLLLLNADWAQVRTWIAAHAGKDVVVSILSLARLSTGISIGNSSDNCSKAEPKVN